VPWELGLGQVLQPLRQLLELRLDLAAKFLEVSDSDGDIFYTQPDKIGDLTSNQFVKPTNTLKNES